jgi:hypothetical protein
MTGDDDPIGMEVEKSITLVIGRVTKEHTQGGMR